MSGPGEIRHDPRISLRIAQTTDLHGHVCGFDYTADRVDPALGLARLAQVIDDARRDAPQMLLVDNGDALFGNPLADLWAENPAPRGPHPMIAAMNALGYDAAGLGNHEFNFGLNTLTEALAPAQFPLLSANVQPLPGGTVPWQPMALIPRDLPDRMGRRHRLMIGFVSVMPPQVMQWDARHLAGKVTASGMVACLRATVPALRAAGADLVVVLNHSGPGDGSDDPRSEDAGLAIARLPGVDAVICGHHHRLFPGPGHPDLAGVDAVAGRLATRPAIMAGSRGSHLGILDLDLVQHQAAGGGAGWRVADAVVHLRPVTGQAPAAAIRALTDAAHRSTRAAMAQVVGHLPQRVTSHWDQAGHPGVSALVAAAQRWHAARVLQGLPEGALPLLSAAAPFRCGGDGGAGNFVDLRAGPLRQRDLHAIYGFPNELRVVLATGADLVDWLERSAGQFAQLVPGRRDQPLIAQGFPPYNFDTLFGLSYRFDLSQPAVFGRDGSTTGPGRVRGLCWQGRPVDPQQRFAVVTNSYRAEGGGGFAALPAVRAPGLDLPVRRVIEAYVAAGLPDGPDLSADWGFAALPGTTALLRTAPQATPPTGLAARCLGLDAAGFLQVELTL